MQILGVSAESFFLFVHNGQVATRSGQTALSKANTKSSHPLPTTASPHMSPAAASVQVKFNPKTSAWPARPGPSGRCLALDAHLQPLPSGWLPHSALPLVPCTSRKAPSRSSHDCLLVLMVSLQRDPCCPPSMNQPGPASACPITFASLFNVSFHSRDAPRKPEPSPAESTAMCQHLE